MLTRRSVLQASLAGAWASAFARGDTTREPLHIASNEYPWKTFFDRDQQVWSHHEPRCLSRFADSGVMGMEPIVTSVDDLARLSPMLRDFRQEMRSIYINTRLFDRTTAGDAVTHAVAIVEEARLMGTTIVVTNPEPIQWGGTEDKTDEQLTCQAEFLDKLGAEISRLGLRLAYHNHDAEMRASAREFHHMLGATSPDHVALCLDAHWIYRGSGNSQVCLFDIVRLYGDRIVELHLRQSSRGIWTETFGPGDIDYGRLAGELARRGLKPHLVLEQAVEKGTVKSKSAIDAHRDGLLAARELFSAHRAG